ncbi:MAG: Hydroxyacylglutathione hydrolase [uncultured Chloroflexi bacterium]|uniref:Hydroxyacylglutathione hydrolase n=1 Tax=uncultured Chloroflexota bacterium TaxID=166587 RepID=A0A6J4KFY7_9CHLR|nr:MAG: Hydroxyacylglutathione hydrolase [uncultured Chloroflexota bacterium]
MTVPYEIVPVVCGPLQNNVYVVCDAEAQVALAVDCGLEAAVAVGQVLRERELRLETIVATHGHFDHMAEVAALARATGAQVLVHRDDAERLRQPSRPMLFPKLDVEPAPVSRELVEGDTVALGDAVLAVWHTPGHTPGSLCLYDATRGMLFSGDTLFAGTFGRYDLPGGDPAVLKQSLLRLATLPPDTQVLPGHNAVTTIGRERWLTRPPL